MKNKKKIIFIREEFAKYILPFRNQAEYLVQREFMPLKFFSKKESFVKGGMHHHM